MELVRLAYEASAVINNSKIQPQTSSPSVHSEWGIDFPLRAKPKLYENKTLNKDLVASLAKNNSITIPDQDPKKKRKDNQEKRQATAGPRWFDLPATTLTPEIKNDWAIINARPFINRDRFYKKDNRKEPPKYFQVGTVVSGAGEFYSSRLTNRERSNQRTFVDSIVNDTQQMQYIKNKMKKINHEKSFKINKRKETNDKDQTRKKSRMKKGKK